LAFFLAYIMAYDAFRLTRHGDYMEEDKSSGASLPQVVFIRAGKAWKAGDGDLPRSEAYRAVPEDQHLSPWFSCAASKCALIAPMGAEQSVGCQRLCHVARVRNLPGAKVG
jgi:hypothetical protein